MGHKCCTKQIVKRGLWSPEEDEKLVAFLTTQPHSSWSSVPKLAGLQRCGKSCRLRWINYLRPDLKKGAFTEEEERTIIEVHRILGNKWAQIAKHLPGRTDNEVKNLWNSSLKKKLLYQGVDPTTHKLILPKTNYKHYYPHETNSVFTIDHQTYKKGASTKLSTPPVSSLPVNVGSVYPFGYLGFELKLLEDDHHRPYPLLVNDGNGHLGFDHDAALRTDQFSSFDFGFGDCSSILQGAGVFGDEIVYANGDEYIDNILT